MNWGIITMWVRTTVNRMKLLAEGDSGGGFVFIPNEKSQNLNTIGYQMSFYNIIEML